MKSIPNVSLSLGQMCMPHVVGVKQMSLGMLGKDGALYLSDPELLSLSKLCTDLPFERDQHHTLIIV